jgi:succinate dehydrogenase / fumarate reductase membrane anchor subunit
MAMVDNVTSFSRNGLRDWLTQRVTALVMAIYAIVLLVCVLSVDHLSYQFWHDLYHHPVVRVLSILVLLSIIIHAWIGLWTVYTDYIKATGLRLVLQVSTILGLMAILAWGIGVLCI